MAGSVKLLTPSGGSVTINATDTASSLSLTLPATNDNIITANTTQTLTNKTLTNPVINGFTGDTSAITIGTTQFVKDTSGNIGIGTATPNAKLHVVTAGGNIIQLNSTNASGGYATFQTSGTSVGYLGTAAQLSSGSLSDFCLRSEANLVFGVAGTEKMRLDSSGNLGLGVTPSAWYSTLKAMQIGGTASVSHLNAGVGNQQANYGNNFYYNASGVETYIQSTGAQRYRQLSGAGHVWEIAPSGTAGNAISFTQAMTLDASGNLLVGCTSINPLGSTRLVLSENSGTTKWAVGPIDIAVNNFYVYAATGAGVVLLGTSATSWSSNSDERLKTDLKPIENAAQKVSTLRAVTGRYKTDDESVSRSFLIAQDVEAVLPEAVGYTKLVGADDETDYLALAYTDTIPLLVAAIKELSAQNNALEARLAQLEAK